MINKFITDKAKKKESKTSHGFRRTQKKNQDFSEKEDAILIEKVNENAEHFLLGLATKSQTKRKKLLWTEARKNGITLKE